MNCSNCSLSKTRYNIVKGRGDIPAEVLFIGEGPDASDDIIGKAFIGMTGELVDKMRSRAGIDKLTTYYTNIVLCCPTKSKGGKNRAPSSNEIMACKSNVDKIIEEVNPSYIVLVGDIAKKYFRKRFPRAVYMTHPSILIHAGGTNAPLFLDNVHRLGQISIQRQGRGLLPA